MQQKNAFVFICAFIMIILCIFTIAHADEVIGITQVPNINIDNNSCVFDIVVDGFDGSGSYSAKAIVATYDSDGKMIATSVEKVNSYGLATVHIPIYGNEVSYKLMVHDNNIDLKPLCPEYEGTFLEDAYDCLELNSNDIRTLKQENKSIFVEYYIGSSNKISKINISEDIELYINDSLENYFESGNYDIFDKFYEIINTEDVCLTFYDRDNDNIYDILKSYNYNYGIVDDISLNTITLNGYVYDITAEGLDVTFKDTNGDELTIDDFTTGEFVAYLCDIYENENITGKLTVIKYDNFVSGKVETVYTSNKNEYITVNDIEYVWSCDKDISLGDIGKFYISYSGKIVYYIQDKSNINYAYILEAALLDSAFTADRWQVKLLTKDHGVVIYDMTDDVSCEFDDYVYDHLNKYGEVYWEREANPYRLIEYKLDGQGRIKDFAVHEFTYSEIDWHEYNINTQMLGDYSLADDVDVFLVNDYHTDDLCVKDLSYLVDNGLYEGGIYLDDDGKCPIMIITAGEIPLSSRAGLAVVTKMSNEQDSKGNDVIRLDFVQDGEEKTLFVTDDTKSITRFDYDDITAGSTFIYSQVEGNIELFAVISLYKNGTTELSQDICDVFDDTEIIYGYIANTARESVSSGEMLTIADDKGELHTVFITNDTNKYTYDDRFMLPYIHTEDFLATDNTWYFDEESGVATPVIVKIYGGEVTDICSFNTPVNVEDMTASDEVKMLGTGTTTYPSETVKLNSIDIVNINENTNIMVCYINPSEYSYGDVSKIKMDNNAKLYLNHNKNYLGEEGFTVKAMMDLIGDCCELILEDSDGDKDYDVINASKYNYEIVEYVDAERSQIILGGRNVYLNSNGIDVEIFDNNGNEITLSDIKAGDVIAWFCDGSRPTTSQYIKIKKCVGIEGTVESTWTSNGRDYAEINGKTYKLDKYVYDIIVGDYGNFYTNCGGNVIEYFEWIDTSEYGYILEAALSDSSFTADRWQVKLLTKDHGVVIYDMTDDASCEFDYYVYNCLNGNRDYISWEVEANPDRLIAYKLDSQGRIRNFEVGDLGFKEIDEDDEYNASTQMIGGYFLRDDIAIFLIDDYCADNVTAEDLSYLVEGGKYIGGVYINDKGECVAMVITGKDISMVSRAGISIVTKTVRTKDTKGNDVVDVTFVQDGEEKTLLITDDTVCITPYIDADDITPGSSFVYLQKEDSIETIAFISMYNNNTSELTEYIHDILGEDTKVIYGYIANTGRKLVNAGEMLTIVDGEGEDYRVVVTDNTNKYTYDDRFLQPYVHIDDFLATDNTWYFDKNSRIATPVIVKIYGGEVTDICSFNTPVNVEDMSASDDVKMLGTGTTIYPGKIVKINSTDIVNTSENTNVMVYYTNPSEYTYGDISKIKIDNSAKLYLNHSNEFYLGGGVFSVKTMMNLINGCCEFVFEDSDGDKDYDVINAELYTYEVLEYVDTQKSKIILGGTTVSLNSGDIELEILDNDGNEITLSDIKENDVIAWLCDGSRPTTSQYIKIKKCVGIEGAVESTWTSNGRDYAEINGKTYKLDKYVYDISVGDYGNFYTDNSGSVIEYFQWIDTSDYGYILEAALSDSSFTADYWQVKLLTKDSGVVTYDLTEDASCEFDDYVQNCLNGNRDYVSWEEEANPHRLIAYKLDSQGRIKSFNIPDFKFKRIDGYKYYSNTQTINGNYLEDDITIFLVDDENTNNLSVKNLSYLADACTYDGGVFVDYSGECSIMIVTNVDIGFSIDEGLAIVTKVVRTLDSDDNEVTRINFVQNEEERSVIINNDSVCLNNYYDYSDIGVGTTFGYIANNDVVEKYVITSTFDEDGFFACTDYDYIFNDDVQIYCGYISNQQKNMTSKGELIEVDDNYTFMISDLTNKYTYDNSGRYTEIVVGDFLAGDAWYADWYKDYDDDVYEVTPVIVSTVNGKVTDIYTSGKRICLDDY